MDYSHANELFQWQEGVSFLDKDLTLDVSELTWDGDTQDEDFSYILEETTPVKACGDAPYHFGPYGETSKDSDECQVTSSRVKRRRALQFDDEDLNLTFQSDDCAFLKSEETIDVIDEGSLQTFKQGETSKNVDECQVTSSRVKRRRVLQFDDDSAFLKSKETVDVIDEGFSQTFKQGVGFPEASVSSEFDLGCLDQVEDWLGLDCFDNSQPHNNNTYPIPCGTNDVLIDIAELMNSPPRVAAITVPKQTVKTPRNVVFKGTKSYMKVPSTKIGTSVAYPFAFIKPSGANGDMTLKEINERIRIPSPVKPKTMIYETSPFSGKPVVNKARIRTEGGQGSITIMRTQG